MPYSQYNKTKPDGVGSGTVTLQEIRDNLNAVRDGIMLNGLPGFNCAASGGTEDQPATYLFTGTGANSTERINGAVTWGTTGGELGNPKTVVFTYSSDSGVTYPITIGTLTVTYTPNGYFSSYAWS